MHFPQHGDFWTEHHEDKCDAISPVKFPPRHPPDELNTPLAWSRTPVQFQSPPPSMSMSSNSGAEEEGGRE